jgi:uncharacterized Fe-S cluster protein YjdI
MREFTKRCTGDGVTVVWQPGLCVHSQVCFHGLPAVFDPRKRPWVNMDGAPGAAIADQVRRCPSGALALADPEPVETALPEGTTRITPTLNGPLLVRGEIEIVLRDAPVERISGSCLLCRCGQSSNKPYCDGSHAKVGFKG